MTPIVLCVPGSEALAGVIASELTATIAELEYRQFPDGEYYCRTHTALADREVIVVGTLAHPTDKFLLLAFLASMARDEGARRVGLVTPYLAFMRQDASFAPGEAVTAVHFAKLMSTTFDWLVTVDPHLHRVATLSELYSIPTQVAHAASDIAAWVRTHVAHPYFVGPDLESHQWVQAVADKINAPCLILEKTRRGDRDVSVSTPTIQWQHAGGAYTPVIIDDIISTGRTMLRAVEQVTATGGAAPVCIGIHPVFADDVEAQLRNAGARDVISCNTIAHSTNAICVRTTIAQAVGALLA